MYLLNLFRRLRLSRSTLLASLIILSLIGFLLVFSSQMFTQDQFSHLENSIYHRKVNNDDETRSELNQRTLTLNPQMTFKKSTCRTSSWGPIWTVDSNGGVCRYFEIQSNGCCNITTIPLSISQTDSSDDKSNDMSKDTQNFDTMPEFLDKKDEENSKRTFSDSVHRQPLSHSETDQLICPTCIKEHQCCSQYEFCVSCCMKHTWSKLLENPKENHIKLRLKANSRNNNKNGNMDATEETEIQVDDESVKSLFGGKGDETVVREYSHASHDLFNWCLLKCRTSSRSVVHQNSFRSPLKHCYGPKDPPLLARNQNNEVLDP